MKFKVLHINIQTYHIIYTVKSLATNEILKVSINKTKELVKSINGGDIVKFLKLYIKNIKEFLAQDIKLVKINSSF